MSISNYFETFLLQSLRNVSVSVENTYLQLHIGAPGEDGINNIAFENRRKLVVFGPAFSGTISNLNIVEWLSVADSETYTHFSLWDDETAGNCLWTGINTADPVFVDDNFRVNPGQLTLTLD